MKSYPKSKPYRNRALVKAYRVIPCQWCGADDGTVVAAHANWSEYGKGMGMKASDDACASLCFRCHMELDQGKNLSYEERKQGWLTAHERTIEALKALGLWPEDL